MSILMFILLLIAAFTLGLAFLLYYMLEKKQKYKDLKKRHVVITGGSSGIGKAAAIEAAILGANITIIGRNVAKLKTAVEEITPWARGADQKVQYVSLDVTSNYETIEKSLSSIEKDFGPIFMLINSAGSCVSTEFENMRPEDIKMMIDLNYFGTAYPTRYVLPGMKKRNEGVIVFVASQAALIGIYGYSGYNGGKWAVRGLAEALFMELIGSKVSLTLAFPPDTDTPGFEQEQIGKPRETKMISGSGGLVSADEVGIQIVHDAMKGKSYSTFGFGGKVMAYLFCSSVESVSQVLIQVFTMGAFRAIVVPIMLSFHKIVKDGVKDRQEEAKKKKAQ